MASDLFVCNVGKCMFELSFFLFGELMFALLKFLVD
jgi:hypothetical protein